MSNPDALTRSDWNVILLAVEDLAERRAFRDGEDSPLGQEYRRVLAKLEEGQNAPDAEPSRPSLAPAISRGAV